ncbi:MAG TPA: hypothetical protein VIL49_04140 [Capillimicrobium sp.]
MNPNPRAMLAAAAAGAAIALAACGGGDESSTAASTASTAPAASDAELAEQAVVDYVAAFADRDPAAACAHMTDAGQAHVMELQAVDTCEKAVENILAGVPDDWLARFRNTKIGRVEVRGDLAVVLRPDDSDEGVAAPPVARRVGDRWLVEFER